MAEDQRSSHDIVVEVLYDLGLATSREEVKPDTRLEEDLGMDSLDTVYFVMDLEAELDIDIPEEQVDNARTVQEVSAALDKIRGI